jgi:hypothetical protein
MLRVPCGVFAVTPTIRPFPRIKSVASAGRQRAAVLGHKVEEIPLRHERHELAAARHVSEIGKLQDGLTEAGAQLANFVVRDFQEIVEQSEFVDDT